jgi:ribonuclease R
MLPRELSNGICSLNPGEERLALTVKTSLDKSGKVKANEIFESLIKSDFRMTYSEVTAILEGDKKTQAKYNAVTDMLFLMKELRDKLIAIKEKRGAIEFESNESKFVFDGKGGVKDIKQYPYEVSNSIIEEFMVLTNTVVAEKFDKLKLPFVYRVHEKPEEEKLKEIKKIKGPLPAVMLRGMPKAVYKPKCEGHFGLALKYYCHFTSPIRRYPDLLIHRIIKMYLHGKLAGGIISKMKYDTEVASRRSSERERAADTAERDADDTYKAAYMAQHIGEEFEGVISGVTAFGIFVELPNTCEGLVHIRYLPPDDYTFVEAKYLLQGKANSFVLGQTVRIKVAAAKPAEGKVSFDLV